MNSRDYLAHPLSRSNFTYRTASKRLVFTAVRDAEGTASLGACSQREEETRRRTRGQLSEQQCLSKDPHSSRLLQRAGWLLLPEPVQSGSKNKDSDIQKSN